MLPGLFFRVIILENGIYIWQQFQQILTSKIILLQIIYQINGKCFVISNMASIGIGISIRKV